jgi:hypothetical protein
MAQVQLLWMLFVGKKRQPCGLGCDIVCYDTVLPTGCWCVSEEPAAFMFRAELSKAGE